MPADVSSRSLVLIHKLVPDEENYRRETRLLDYVSDNRQRRILKPTDILGEFAVAKYSSAFGNDAAEERRVFH